MDGQNGLTKGLQFNGDSNPFLNRKLGTIVHLFKLKGVQLSQTTLLKLNSILADLGPIELNPNQAKPSKTSLQSRPSNLETGWVHVVGPRFKTLDSGPDSAMA